MRVKSQWLWIIQICENNSQWWQIHTKMEMSEVCWLKVFLCGVMQSRILVNIVTKNIELEFALSRSYPCDKDFGYIIGQIGEISGQIKGADYWEGVLHQSRWPDRSYHSISKLLLYQYGCLLPAKQLNFSFIYILFVRSTTSFVHITVISCLTILIMSLTLWVLFCVAINHHLTIVYRPKHWCKFVTRTLKVRHISPICEPACCRQTEDCIVRFFWKKSSIYSTMLVRSPWQTSLLN